MPHLLAGLRKMGTIILAASVIVHRIGRLTPGDNIVLVITASAHRQAAFEAAAFLMDYLKTSAPFWKYEETPDSVQGHDP